MTRKIVVTSEENARRLLEKYRRTEAERQLGSLHGIEPPLLGITLAKTTHDVNWFGSPRTIEVEIARLTDIGIELTGLTVIAGYFNPKNLPAGKLGFLSAANLKFPVFIPFEECCTEYYNPNEQQGCTGCQNGQAPSSYLLTVSGIGNGNCDCAPFNGSFLVSWSPNALHSCRWVSSTQFYSGQCQNIAAFWYELFMQPAGDSWRISVWLWTQYYSGGLVTRAYASVLLTPPVDCNFTGLQITGMEGDPVYGDICNFSTAALTLTAQ